MAENRQNHRDNRGERSDSRRPHKEDDLTQGQKEAIRSLTMLKMHLLGAMITEHGIETVVAHPIHIERFLDAKMTSIFSEEETKKLPIYAAIKKHEWVLRDPKCVEIGHRIARNTVNKFAVCDGEPSISIASLQYMPDYRLAQLIFTLGHNAGYRPSKNQSFDWNNFIEAIKASLSHEEYKKVLTEGTRLFEEAVPNTFENLVLLATRNTFMLDTLKKCRPERESKPASPPDEPEQPPVPPEIVPELKLSPGTMEHFEEGDDHESDGLEPLNDEERQALLEDQANPVPALPAADEIDENI